ncbi:MAG: hypothetical protein H6590_06130 [Flavobacteriales bacterium]|nr:hypothetical protein [Flavobacteriales bacterium]
MAITKVTPEMTTFGGALTDGLAALTQADGADGTGFLGLGATPSTFAGCAGLIVKVNPTEDGLIFAVESGGGGTVNFLGLTDTPGSYGDPYQILEINKTGDGLQWRDAPPTPPVVTTDLEDFPSYTGSQGKVLTVSAGGGLQWVTPQAPGAYAFKQLIDTPDTLGNPGQLLRMNDSGTSLEWFKPTETSQVSLSFVELKDCPQTIVPGGLVRGNSAGDGLEFYSPSWPSTFRQLTDTPSTFSGQALKSLRVNAGQTALEFYTPPTVVSTFTGLSDTPGSLGTAGQLVRVNAGGTALEFVDPAAGGVADFTDLGDVPSSYSGTTGQMLVSNGAGLEFANVPTVPDALTDLSDFPSVYSGAAGKFLAVNALGTGVEFVNAPSGGGGGTPTTAYVPPPIMLAVTDETTVITTGASKTTFRAPYAFTLGEVRANLRTASSSGTVTIDVNMNGVSIFSTPLTIDVSEKTSVTASTTAVLSTTAIPDDAEFTVDIDGAGANAVGLKLSLIAI